MIAPLGSQESAALELWNSLSPHEQWVAGCYLAGSVPEEIGHAVAFVVAEREGVAQAEAEQAPPPRTVQEWRWQR